MLGFPKVSTKPVRNLVLLSPAVARRGGKEPVNNTTSPIFISFEYVAFEVRALGEDMARSICVVGLVFCFFFFVREFSYCRMPSNYLPDESGAFEKSSENVSQACGYAFWIRKFRLWPLG